MSAADNKVLVRRCLAALWEQWDLTVLEAFLAPHYQRHLTPYTPPLPFVVDKEGAQLAAQMVAREPIGRLGTPEEVAETVVWLCSDAASLHCQGLKKGGDMENVLIRACTHNDIDAILQLDRQWEQENIAHDFMPISREEFIASLERFPAYFLVAESDGCIVGYIHGSVHRRNWVAVLPAGEPYVEIENVYVQPDFRNRRIGSKLMERLLAVAEHHGIQRFLVSTVSKEMEKILHFYRRHGFTPWHVQMFK